MTVADLLFFVGIACILVCAGLSAFGAMEKGQRVADDFFSPFLPPEALTHPTSSERHPHAAIFFWLAAVLFLLSYLMR